MSKLVNQNTTSYRMGFEDGKVGKKFFCPCQGNKDAENDYYFGWLAGQAARGQQ